MVDIDPAEITKFTKLGRKIDVGLCMDAGEFIASIKVNRPLKETIEWNMQVRRWRALYDNPTVPWPGINPYELVKEIGKWTTSNDVICSDTGCALGWMMQGFPFKGERFIHAFNMTPMGYGLPASIGASFATGKRVVLVTGDGSIMMSLPELATIARHGLNIKVILLNNQGHAMCRQTQRQWLGGKYPATSVEGGLGFPDFTETACAFGIDTYSILEALFEDDMPGFLEVHIHPDAYLIPQAKYGDPLEDADPKLPREEFASQMIVDTL